MSLVPEAHRFGQFNLVTDKRLGQRIEVLAVFRPAQNPVITFPSAPTSVDGASPNTNPSG